MAMDDWSEVDNLTIYDGKVYDSNGEPYTVSFSDFSGMWTLKPDDPNKEPKYIANGLDLYEDYSPKAPEAEKPDEKTAEAPAPEAEKPDEKTAEAPAPEAEKPDEKTAEAPAPKAEKPDEKTAEAPAPEAEKPDEKKAATQTSPSDAGEENPDPSTLGTPSDEPASTANKNEEEHDNTTPTIPRVTHEQWEAKVTELMKSGKYNSTEEAEAAANKALGIDAEPPTSFGNPSDEPAKTGTKDEEDHDNTTPTIPRVTHQQWETKVIELMKSGKYNSIDEAEAAASAALGIKSEADTIPDAEVEAAEAKAKARAEAEAKDRQDAIDAYKKLHPGATDEEAAAAVDADNKKTAYDNLTRTYSDQMRSALTTAGLKDYSSVDFDSIDEVTADWDRIISSFQGYIEGKAAECEGFKLAQDAEVENGIIKSLDDRVTNIISMLQASSSTIKSVAQLLLQTDEDVGKDAPEQEGGDDDSGTPEPTPTPTPTNPSGGNKGKENTEEQVKLLEGLNMSDLSDLTDELIKYCQENNIELDKLINDENYASQLKLALLDSEVLSQDMKTKIMEGLESSTQKALQSVIRGSSTEQIGLNDDTKLVIQETLTRIANANQTSLENLLKDDKYAKIVKEAIGSISKNYTDLGTKEDPTKNLESIIKTELVKQEGTDSSNVIDLNADTNNIVAKYIKVFASNKNISNVDELLNNSELKSSLKTLGNLSAFSDNISKFGDSTTQSILYDLLVGGNN